MSAARGVKLFLEDADQVQQHRLCVGKRQRPPTVVLDVNRLRRGTQGVDVGFECLTRGPRLRNAVNNGPHLVCGFRLQVKAWATGELPDVFLDTRGRGGKLDAPE